MKNGAQDLKDTELRRTQIKLVEEETKRKHQLYIEKIRHENVMEELKFMADNKITVYSRNGIREKRFKEKKVK